MKQSQTLTLEAQVVGAVLGSPSLYPRAAFLQAESFSDPIYSTLWRLIERTILDGAPVSPAGITTRYPSEVASLGGHDFLTRTSALGEAVSTCFNEAVDRIHEDHQWRRLSTITARLNSAIVSKEKSPEQILSGLIELSRAHLTGGRDSIRSKREVALSAIEHAREERPTVTTGIDNLDFLMQGGLQPKRLYGMGGIYGRGKTILLGTISDNLNLQGVPHLFISLETPPEDIEIRNCARHLNLNASSIHDVGDLDHKTFVDTADDYITALPDNAFYEFVPGATMDEIHRLILRAKTQRGIKGVFLDYWQLVRGKERGQSEEEHLRNVANRLAAICRQEDIWCVMSAQVDERGRLKVSDALYQAAALYVRLQREEDDSAAYFVTEKSNYTRYRDTGNESVPGMVFDDMVGPHFRNAEASDIGNLNREDEIRI